MQTFLPYTEFHRSAAVLDYRRLGKQRVEALQILNCIKNGGGWGNHPAVLMWRGWEHLLVDYGLAVCSEWKKLGYNDTCSEKIAAFDAFYHNQRDGRIPSWLGDERLHASHRSNLLRKDLKFYGAFGWSEPDNLPYYWPVTKDML